MPENFVYVGTVTFHSNKGLEEKQQLIDKFPSFLGQNLPFYKQSEYYLKFSIEYHKVEGMDDPEAPHIHFMLYSKLGLKNMWYNNVQHSLKDVYGRSQFFRATQLKAKSWEVYMNKDWERLDKMYGIPHYKEIYIEKPHVNIDFETIEEDLDTSDYY